MHFVARARAAWAMHFVAGDDSNGEQDRGRFDMLAAAMELSAPGVGQAATNVRHGLIEVEWRHGIRSLTVTVSVSDVTYLRAWGCDPITQMEAGELNRPEELTPHWEWLTQCLPAHY